MKKIACRLVIALLFACIFCISTSVSAEETAPKQYTNAMATQLQTFLLGQNSSVTEDFDINADTIINATDLSLMKQLIISESASDTTAITTATSFDMEETTTSTTVTSELTTTQTTSEPIVETITTMPRDGYGYLEHGISNAFNTTITVPAYTENLYEVKDGSFLFEKDGITYGYSLLCEKETPLYLLISDVALVKGIHIWVYNGEETALSLEDPLPDTTGLTFQIDDPNFVGQTFGYDLMEYSTINPGYVIMVSELINPKTVLYPSDVGGHDYNLNGHLDGGDVDIMTKYLVANPYNFFFDLESADAFYRYFDNMSKFGHTHLVILKDSAKEPVPYAFNIPTADIIIDPNAEDDPEITEYAEMPVQILPNTYAKELEKYPELTKYSDETADFYAWFAEEKSWAKVSKESKRWKFQSGCYVYLLDDNGKYVMQWIAD